MARPLSTTTAWTAPTRTPPYYPDAVTLSPDVEEHDLLARVDDSDGCSVKDSWARLDLSLEDFARLVVGEWVWLDPATPLPDLASSARRTWERVTTADEMTDVGARLVDRPRGGRILRPSLLDEPGVHVLAARGAGRSRGTGRRRARSSTSRVRSPGSATSSRVTATSTGPGARPRRAAREVAGGIPLVGWEAGASVEAAVAAGCERLGPLTVWLK